MSEISMEIDNIMQMKDSLLDPKTISKKVDQFGRDQLASQVREVRQLRDEITETKADLDKRQKSAFVKIKNLIRIPDQQTINLQAKRLEQNTKEAQISDPRTMIEAYYEKVADTPLTNQEKRDLLQPEVLSELTTEEYIALWKRLNPYFLTHVTRQGFRDHTGGDVMVNHANGENAFGDGFTDVMKNKKRLFPPMARIGLENREEPTVKDFLDKWVLLADDEAAAKARFETRLHESMGSAPTFPDKTATHLAAQIASDYYYGGETQNEVFFVYPSDVLASQYSFAFNGWEKDFTRPQSETKWNDVFVWTDPNKPGIPVDMGVVFLPENTRVDPDSGSKYASEIKEIDGKQVKVMVENDEVIKNFEAWARSLNSESPIIKAIGEARRNRYIEDYDNLLKREMMDIGVPSDSLMSLLILSSLSQDLFLFEANGIERYINAFMKSNAKWKRSEKSVPAKEYWEDYFSKNPELRPRHVVYYDGDPTSAIYRFQQKNEIGGADTSKSDGKLLGFDDHHVIDMENDPRSNQGHQELLDLGNRIIEEHYRPKSAVQVNL